MERLHALVGVESELSLVSSTLRRFVQTLRPPVVGAYHLTCSDETEWHCLETFQREFADHLLPPLKPNVRAAVHTANLGARYEWGAARVTEEHFATVASQERFKLIVLKLNSHVGAAAAGGEIEYGTLDRYQIPSICCDTLNAVIEGGQLPAIQQLRELYRSGGRNRLNILMDRELVEPRYRALAMSIVNAWLQAHQAASDVQQYRPETPTVYLILPCVTINRPGADTELVIGQYGIDWTERAAKVKYDGLGDDPSRYRYYLDAGRLRVEDDQWPRLESA